MEGLHAISKVSGCTMELYAQVVGEPLPNNDAEIAAEATFRQTWNH